MTSWPRRLSSRGGAWKDVPRRVGASAARCSATSLQRRDDALAARSALGSCRGAEQRAQIDAPQQCADPSLSTSWNATLEHRRIYGAVKLDIHNVDRLKKTAPRVRRGTEYQAAVSVKLEPVPLGWIPKAAEPWQT